jgi:hypothetical protein
MPAKSQAQQRFMGLCAHHPEQAKGHCPSKEVAMDYAKKPAKAADLPEKSNPGRPHGSAPYSDAEMMKGYRVVSEGVGDPQSHYGGPPPGTPGYPRPKTHPGGYVA